MNKTNNAKYKTIFSLRVRDELRILGFEPLLEVENLTKPGFKCWKYRNDEPFQLALDQILGGK